MLLYVDIRCHFGGTETLSKSCRAFSWTVFTSRPHVSLGIDTLQNILDSIDAGTGTPELPIPLAANRELLASPIDSAYDCHSRAASLHSVMPICLYDLTCCKILSSSFTSIPGAVFSPHYEYFITQIMLFEWKVFHFSAKYVINQQNKHRMSGYSKYYFNCGECFMGKYAHYVEI